MQGLVYIFIALCGVGIGAATYFGLAFTPVESGLTALIVALGGYLVHERNLRRRAESRLEKGIEELGRLLSTDAQAGQVLSKRVNALADLDIGSRLEIMEADMSVLGTVVRQVAEAVSDLESNQAALSPANKADPVPGAAVFRHPTVPIETVRRALDDGRLVQHTQPVVTLPQRKVHAYDLVPRLRLEQGQLVDPPEYMPVRNAEGDIVIRRIERICTEEAIKVVRRARLVGNPVKLNFDISRATLSDKGAIDQLVTLLAANRAVNPDINVSLDHEDWQEMDRVEEDMLGRIVQQGVGVGLRNVFSLRLDFGSLYERGVRFLGVDVAGFLKNPAKLSDFHSADIDDYIRRFGINMVMTNVTREDQILALLDDGIKLAQGPVIAKPGPIRHDLRDDGDDDMRQTARR